MTKDSFHHGNLRAELLERAEVVLRERGIEGLSLRELARDAGVSHGAPRAHFVDRAALLDALAERAFDRLTEISQNAVDSLPAAPVDASEALRAAGLAYLDFAERNAALMGLMVAVKADNPSGAVHDASLRFFSTMSALVSAVTGAPESERERILRLTLLLSATLQGVASLVASGRTTEAQGRVLLDDALAVFVAGTRRAEA